MSTSIGVNINKTGIVDGDIIENSNDVVFHKNGFSTNANLFYDPNKEFWLSGSDYQDRSTRVNGKWTVISNSYANCWSWPHYSGWSTSYLTKNIMNDTSTYTLSVDIKTTGLTSNMRVYLETDFRRRDHSHMVPIHIYFDPKYDGKWHRYSGTLTGTAEDQTNCLIGITAISDASGLIVEYKNIKYEESSFMTPDLRSENEGFVSVSYNRPIDCNEIKEF